MSDFKHATEISFAGTFACSAFSACFAEVLGSLFVGLFYCVNRHFLFLFYSAMAFGV